MSRLRPSARWPGALVLACSVMSAGVAAVQLISVRDEVRLGQEAQEALRRETPEVADEGVRAYIEHLGHELASHASGEAYPYSFSVADYRELNAFALPGGPVWVHRGILEAADAEAQLAGVLAHEIAHVSERHAARQITKETVANGLVSLLGALMGDEGAGASAAQVAAGVTAGSFMLKFSRDDERDADREGVLLLQRAGYDPRGLLEFMRMLERQEGRSPGSVAQFLSTHPAPASRVRDLTPLVASAPSGRRTSPVFNDARRRLARLPPARQMPRR